MATIQLPSMPRYDPSADRWMDEGGAGPGRVINPIPSSPYQLPDRTPSPPSPDVARWEGEGGASARDPAGTPRMQAPPAPGRGVGYPPGVEPVTNPTPAPYQSNPVPATQGGRGLAMPGQGGGGLIEFDPRSTLPKFGPIIEGTLAGQYTPGGVLPNPYATGVAATMYPTPAAAQTLQPGQPGDPHAPARDAFSGVTPNPSPLPMTLSPVNGGQLPDPLGIGRFFAGQAADMAARARNPGPPPSPWTSPIDIPVPNIPAPNISWPNIPVPHLPGNPTLQMPNIHTQPMPEGPPQPYPGSLNIPMPYSGAPNIHPYGASSLGEFVSNLFRGAPVEVPAGAPPGSAYNPPRAVYEASPPSTAYSPGEGTPRQFQPNMFSRTMAGPSNPDAPGYYPPESAGMPGTEGYRRAWNTIHPENQVPPPGTYIPPPAGMTERQRDLEWQRLTNSGGFGPGGWAASPAARAPGLPGGVPGGPPGSAPGGFGPHGYDPRLAAAEAAGTRVVPGVVGAPAAPGGAPAAPGMVPAAASGGGGGGRARNFNEAWAQYQRVHPDAGLYEMNLLAQSYGRPPDPISQAAQSALDKLHTTQRMELEDAIKNPLADVDAQAQRILELTRQHRQQDQDLSGGQPLERSMVENMRNRGGG